MPTTYVLAEKHLYFSAFNFELNLIILLNYHGQIQRIGKGGGGGRGWVQIPLENRKLLIFITLEILVQIPLKNQLDPLDPINSGGRSIPPSVKYV